MLNYTQVQPIKMIFFGGCPMLAAFSKLDINFIEAYDFFLPAIDISIDNEVRMQSAKDVFFTHHTIKGADFTLSSIDQSLGTLRYFQLQECTFNMLHKDHIPLYFHGMINLLRRYVIILLIRTA